MMEPPSCSRTGLQRRQHDAAGRGGATARRIASSTAGSAIERAMLIIDDLSVRIAGRLLIEHASVRIPAGARVGLVGRNGSGKTTLFRVIAGDLAAEGGPRRDSAALAHRPARAGGAGWAGKPDRDRARRRRRARPPAWPKPRPRTIRIASPKSRRGSPTSAPMRRPARAAAILSGLGFSPPTRSGPAPSSPAAGACGSRSRPRCSPSPTCCCSTSRPTISTSKARSGCEDHLARYPRTVIVISHDRDLLDTSVDFILPLENSKLTLYRGGYSAFEKPRNERLVLDQKARQEAGGAAQAPAGLRRPLPRQGDQGAPGAIARQDAGEDGADRGDRR